MKLKQLSITALLIGSLFFPVLASAQTSGEGLEVDETPGEAFYRGQVVKILEHRIDETGGNRILNQKALVRLTSGERAGEEIEIDNQGVITLGGGEGVKEGDRVVVYRIDVQGEQAYYIADHYRIPSLIWIVLLFFVTAVALARWKGLTSILGLGVSVLVIVFYIVPQITKGANPILVSLLGALVIAVVSIYLSHGFNRRTSVALGGTLITLGLAAVVSLIFVSLAKLFGTGSEQAFYLQFSGFENLNLQGLLLGGIILGALGVLDDITTAQSATVEEIHKANPSLSMRELYQRGSSVGSEHIASLVNTLFLAYAGASLPLFLFFTVSNPQPLWVTLNTEFIAEEVVRTIIGSISLLLAVPITTLLAAYFHSKNPSK